MAYILRRVGASVGLVLLSMAILVFAWDRAIDYLVANGHASAFIAKRPMDVVNYFFTTGQDKVPPGQHRHDLLVLLGTTLWHSLLGFVVGVAGSSLLAIVFMLVRPLEFMFMPIALVLRTVPLLAMAPVIYLIFGDGLVAAALVGSVVVFFPILVNLAVGFRSVSPQSVDVVRVNGGGRWTVLRKVALPTALPQLFASMRIAVPGAITGAMLYEWMLTSKGLGGHITLAKAYADYQQIWAIVVLVTLTSIVLYTVASLVEEIVLTRFGFVSER